MSPFSYRENDWSLGFLRFRLLQCLHAQADTTLLVHFQHLALGIKVLRGLPEINRGLTPCLAAVDVSGSHFTKGRF
jgi:hypothetical protein